jgi:hypothetical protein
MTSLRQPSIEDMQTRNLAVNTQFYYVQQASRFAGLQQITGIVGILAWDSFFHLCP